MLDHCYSRDYPAVQSKHRGAQGFVFDARLLILADKYICPSLAKDIQAAFVREASDQTLEQLEKIGVYAAIDIIYGLPSNSLVEGARNAFIEQCVHVLPVTTDDGDFHSLTGKHPRLMSDCLRSLCKVTRLSWNISSSCSECDSKFLVVEKPCAKPAFTAHARDCAYEVRHPYCPFCGEKLLMSTNCCYEAGKWLVGYHQDGSS